MKISVLLAAYNGEMYISEQISSILPQLGEDDELSDRLYDKYSDIMSTISMGIPSFVEKIGDRYI